MIRSVLEGILFNIKLISEVFSELDSIAVSGGLFEVKQIREMTANIFSVPCFISDETEPINGLIALKNNPSIQENMCVNQPQKEQVEEYQSAYNKYKKMVAVFY